MLFNIFLGIVFLASACALWYRISLKLPQLVAIPDDIVTSRLHRDSSRWHLMVIHFRSLWREKYFQNLLANAIAKVLHKLHIGLLKIDNALVSVLRKLRYENGNLKGAYTSLVTQEPKNGVQRSAAPAAPSPRRMSEVVALVRKTEDSRLSANAVLEKKKIARKRTIRQGVASTISGQDASVAQR